VEGHCYRLKTNGNKKNGFFPCSSLQLSQNYISLDGNSRGNELLENADVVRFIKSLRIAWLDHVMRMDDKRTPKRIIE
jgi:hypothetical protein